MSKVRKCSLVWIVLNLYGKTMYLQNYLLDKLGLNKGALLNYKWRIFINENSWLGNMRVL